jgi:hypothetical protein
MVVKICDRCQQAYSVDAHVDDYVHICSSGNDTLDNEDIIVTGDWEDYTGSANVPDGGVLVQAQANKLWGTRGQIEGGDTKTLTRRGNVAGNHRVRQHLEYKDFKGGEC